MGHLRQRWSPGNNFWISNCFSTEWMDHSVHRPCLNRLIQLTHSWIVTFWQKYRVFLDIIMLFVNPILLDTDILRDKFQKIFIYFYLFSSNYYSTLLLMQGIISFKMLRGMLSACKMFNFFPKIRLEYLESL